MTDHTQAVETAWSTLCADAGWTPSLYGTPNLTARMTYEAKLDSLAAERAPELRTMIATARAKVGQGFDRNYLDGIDAAIERAITSPRQPR